MERDRAGRRARRDGGQDAYDARLLSWLNDVLLLKRPALWPDSGRGDEALRQWSLVGRAMLAHDEDGRAAEELDGEIRAARDAR